MRTMIVILAGVLVLTCTLNVEAGGLDGPEAVRYDPELDLYFVSNFNGEVSGDSNGFVSKLSPEGEVLVLKFMVGTDNRPFHGPRGMCIDQFGLWVVDSSGVHLFDRNSGEQIDFVGFSQFELGFLNDIVVGKDGALYVTDTGTSSLYRIVDREVSLVTMVPMRPNGITTDPETGKLLLAPWSDSDEIVAWDIDEERFSSVGKLEGGGNFDGIEVVGDRIIIASQMDTSLHFMVDGVDRMAVELPGKPADIAIDTKRNRVAVPYVSLNRVDIIQLED
jgi:sugar lactone lactonase YvrE